MKIFTALVLSVLLTGCGGGGSDSGSTTSNTAAIISVNGDAFDNRAPLERQLVCGCTFKGQTA